MSTLRDDLTFIVSVSLIISFFFFVNRVSRWGHKESHA